MKKLMVATAAICSMCAFADAEMGSEAYSPAWKLTVGGFARGSMHMTPAEMKEGRFELYGADADLMINAHETEDFNLWAGVGFGWAPNQEVYNKTETGAFGASLHQKNDLQYGELRLMLVPEWKATESLSFGLRLGAALDWTRARDKWDISFPGLGVIGEGSDTLNKFMAQGIVGVQTTYMFTDHLGLYANLDWRGGGRHMLKRYGENYGKLSLDGWYAGAGAVLQF